MLMVFRSFKKAMILLITLMLLVLTTQAGPFDGEEAKVNALESVDPIRIEGNTEMSSHTELDSGSGTANDPYVFADMDIDCTSSGNSGLYIAETTRHAIFRNITIHASSSSPAIYLKTLYSGSSYLAQHITLDNITVIGGGTHIYMHIPNYVTVKNCNFSNPSGSGKIIHTYYGYYVYLRNNTFNGPSMDIDLEYTSYSYVRENRGDFRLFFMDRFRYSDIANNTFTMITIRLYSGYHSTIQGNDLTGRSASYDILWIIDCSRVWVSNNSFYNGKDAIFVQHPNAYSPVHEAYYSTTPLIFEYNLFNGTSNRGIYFYYTTDHAYLRYIQVHHNTFRGCQNYAIEVNSGGSSTSKVFRNVFEYNRGSGLEYNANLAQARDGWAQFSWSSNKVGNFWLDWNKEDDNSDGFMDTGDYPLSSSNGQKDPYPVSNPYFDFHKPRIEILTPTERFLSNRYVNFTWEAYDNETGISMIQIKRGVSKWTNITGRDHHGLYLPQGQSLIDIRAVDNAGLKRELNLNLQVQQPGEPVTILSPITNKYYDTPRIDVAWTTIDEMVPASLYISTDGTNWNHRDPSEPFDLVLSDGEYILQLNFTDHYGNIMCYSIPFVIDTKPPDLEILYPKAGSVISNSLVNFIWEAKDKSPLASTLISVDGGEPFTVSGFEYSIFLDKMSHSFEIEVFDMAGNSRTRSLFFTISRNTSLHITSPRLTKPTKYTDHTLEWEYLTNIDVERIRLIIDDRPPETIDPDLLSTGITLEEEGLHDILLKAIDPAGNIFSDSISIEVDRTPPSVGFTYPQDGDILNSTDILARWNAVDDGGISGYELIVNNETVMKDVLDRQGGLSLPPGENHLRIIARDLAGNSAESDIFFTIDTKPPEIEIIFPADDVIREPYVTISWIGSDNLGIAYYNYSVNGEPFRDAGTSTERERQFSEGWHILRVRAVDLAGNSMIATCEFVSDLHPPVVELKGPSSYFISEWSGLISWNITEAVGINRIVLTIDGTPISLATDVSYHIKDLDEGEHTIVLEVTDIGGWNGSDTIRFFLDSTEPKVHSEKDDIEILGNEAKLYWTINEDPEGMSMEVTIDGSIVNIPVKPGDEIILFRELDPGTYKVDIRFTDEAGNEKILSYEFEILKESRATSDDDGLDIWLIFLVLIAICIVALGGILLIIKRKKAGQEAVKKDNTGPARKPEKISFGNHPSMERSQPVQPRQKPSSVTAPAPQKKSPTVESGYIRPERKNKRRMKTRTIRDISDHEENEPIKETAKVDKEEDIEEWGEVEDWSEMEQSEEYEEMEEI